VKPTRSANRTLTIFSSAARLLSAGLGTDGADAADEGGTDGGGAADVGAGSAAPAAIADPHSPQKRTLVGFGAPQLAHTSASLSPHSPQNFRSAAFSLPQLEQSMSPHRAVRLTRTSVAATPPDSRPVAARRARLMPSLAPHA